jgi:hypothetical protein
MGTAKKDKECTAPDCGKKVAKLYTVAWLHTKVCNACRMKRVNQANRGGKTSQASASSDIPPTLLANLTQAPSFLQMMISTPATSGRNSRLEARQGPLSLFFSPFEYCPCKVPKIICASRTAHLKVQYAAMMSGTIYTAAHDDDQSAGSRVAYAYALLMLNHSLHGLTRSFHFCAIPGDGQPPSMEPQQKSHDPKEWTLKALAALRDGLEALRMSRFTVAGHEHGHKIENVANPENFTYLASFVTQADTGMIGPVNGQAVIAKFRQLQGVHTASEEGFQTWLAKLQRDIDLERHAAAVREQRHAAAATSMMGGSSADSRQDTRTPGLHQEDVVKALLGDTELVSKVLDLFLANSDLSKQLAAKLKLMQGASSEHANIIGDLNHASMCLLALDGLPNVKHREMLIKLMEAFIDNGSEVEDWPMMVNLINDFSTMLAADDLRGVRLPEGSLEFWDTFASMVGKGAFNFLRGYGQSSANPDDDGGRSHRERVANGDASDASSDSLSESSPARSQDLGGRLAARVQKARLRKPATQRKRNNFPMPSWRTMQRRRRNKIISMKSAGLHPYNIQRHAVRLSRCKNGALGFTMLYVDKVQLAKKHPGDGCTGKGETDWDDLYTVPGCAGLKARQDWKDRALTAACG